MGRQPLPQPCQAAGVEGAVVIQTAEHESHGREEKRKNWKVQEEILQALAFLWQQRQQQLM